MNIKDDFILKNIHRGYLVGGYVRDFFMEQEGSKDRDIAVKDAENFAKELAEKLDATFIVLDSENKIFRLVLKDKENYLDITELQGKNIEEDLLRRDFTINAIAYDLEKNEYIDVTGGIEDIKNRRLRGIKEENFVDDPLRILRAYRFMATTGFEIDSELDTILKKHQALISKPAKERIHEEIIKLFGGGKYSGGKYKGKYGENGTAETLLKMYESGILELIFPQVKDIEKVPENSHHHLDLIHHSIETVRQIEDIYKTSSEEIIEHLNRVDFGGYPRINHLKLAGFLHDIGKPSTWTIENENGKERHRFIKHDIKGAKIVVPFLKELKFSNKQINYISEMIKTHIYPSNVIMAPNLDDKIMMRYVRKMGENVIDNIILAKADRLSAQGPDITKKMTKENINGLDNLLEFYLKIKPTLKPLPKLLDGVEVMKLLDLKPSKELGRILSDLHEEQICGNINTKEEALDFVKGYKNESASNHISGNT